MGHSIRLVRLTFVRIEYLDSLLRIQTAVSTGKAYQGARNFMIAALLNWGIEEISP